MGADERAADTIEDEMFDSRYNLMWNFVELQFMDPFAEVFSNRSRFVGVGVSHVAVERIDIVDFWVLLYTGILPLGHSNWFMRIYRHVCVHVNLYVYVVGETNRKHSGMASRVHWIGSRSSRIPKRRSRNILSSIAEHRPSAYCL
jgi:hypothetical protein